MRRAVYFVFLLICQFGIARFSAAQAVGGYEFMGSLHPVSTVHSKPLLLKGPEAAGEWTYFGAVSISNTLNVRDDYYIVDAESRRLELAAQYALTEQIDIGVQLPLNWRGSGFTDGWIDDWHKAFDLPRGPRRRIEDDQYNIGGENADYSKFDVDSHGTGLGNLQLTGSYELDRLLSPVIAVSLPGFDSDYAHRGVDLTAGLRSSLDFERLRITGFFLYQMIYDDDFDGMDLPTTSFAAGATASFPLSEQFGLSVGYFVNESILRKLSGANSYETYLDVGVSYRSSGGRLYQFTVRENPGPQSNSVDISGILSVTSF